MIQKVKQLALCNSLFFDMKYYNYILISLKDGNYYIGYTRDLNSRLEAHKNGKVESTKFRRPFKLVYYEVSFNLESSIKREKYLKITYGHRYLKNRLGTSPEGIEL